tara:strand:- start:36 stop:569 length:534 start_codon:yes stop_codon:yes gene_type:complete
MKVINDAILSKQNLNLNGVVVEYLPEIETNVRARIESAKVYVDGQQVACYVYFMRKVVRTIGVTETPFIKRVLDTLESINTGIEAYLQHGSYEYRDGKPGSFRTEAVECKESLLPHHKLGLSYTATGYGTKLPTRYMVKVDNGLSKRWYRVYSICHSNVSSEYIVVRGEKIRVDIQL